MINSSIILLGKSLSRLFRLLNLGHGSTWPGHLALKLNKRFIRDVLAQSNTKIIIVAGTNGKTTTSKLIAHILEKNGKKVLQNESGANLLNGIASTLLLHSDGKQRINYDYAIFEVDENALPLVLKEITPDYLVLLNLFRDQLDRYGEVNTIATKWREAITRLSDHTTLILNADDPQIAYLGLKGTCPSPLSFSVPSPVKRGKGEVHAHAVDSTYCPKCGEKLQFTTVTFSHLGTWSCEHCGLKRPHPDLTDFPYYPLPGLYNQYNTNAAVLTARTIGLDDIQIQNALNSFEPAFGRQEELTVDGKHIKIFLSKNPTGFNESLRTVKELGAKHILFVLNDRIPDGRDVSWIWDTDIEGILNYNEKIIVSGDRGYDMGLRIKYGIPSKFPISNFQFQIETDLGKAISTALQETPKSETLYIVPTYTAMLETRKILTGKKIL